ncbi:hypothetical protein ACTFIU_010430 [Dictyostelium citrinum]
MKFSFYSDYYDIVTTVIPRAYTENEVDITSQIFTESHKEQPPAFFNLSTVNGKSYAFELLDTTPAQRYFSNNNGNFQQFHIEQQLVIKELKVELGHSRNELTRLREENDQLRSDKLSKKEGTFLDRIYCNPNYTNNNNPLSVHQNTYNKSDHFPISINIEINNNNQKNNNIKYSNLPWTLCKETLETVTIHKELDKILEENKPNINTLEDWIKLKQKLRTYLKIKQLPLPLLLQNLPIKLLQAMVSSFQLPVNKTEETIKRIGTQLALLTETNFNGFNHHKTMFNFERIDHGSGKGTGIAIENRDTRKGHISINYKDDDGRILSIKNSLIQKIWIFR